MAKGRNLNQPEQGAFTPINDDAALRGAAKIKRQDRESKSKYLEGPYLGIVAHIEVISANEDVQSFFGEIIESEWKTYKLRVFVPEMDSICGDFTLPTSNNWNSTDMRTIKKLPQFVGQHAKDDFRSTTPNIGDIVVVDYYDSNKPQKGGRYLGIAYNKHGADTLSRRKALEAHQKEIIDKYVKRLKDLKDRRSAAGLSSKECIKTTSIPNVGFLSENNRFMNNPSIPPDFVNNMLYGQICMLGFNPAGTAIEFNKEIVQVYDPNLGGRQILSTKGLLKNISFKGKFIQGTKPLTVHSKVELAFRMVFKQLEYMYDLKDKDILNFKIKTIGGYRPLECARNGDYDVKIVNTLDGKVGCKLKIDKHKLKKGDIRPYPLGISRHSFGLAIDVNADWNPQVDKDITKGEKEYQEWLNSTSQYKIPDKVIQVFKYYGFRWGGNFNRKDLHHFDFIGDPDSIIPAYEAGFHGLQFINTVLGYFNQPPLKPKALKIGNDQEPWNKILTEHGIQL